MLVEQRLAHMRCGVPWPSPRYGMRRRLLPAAATKSSVHAGGRLGLRRAPADRLAALITSLLRRPLRLALLRNVHVLNADPSAVRGLLSLRPPGSSVCGSRPDALATVPKTAPVRCSSRRSLRCAAQLGPEVVTGLSPDLLVGRRDLRDVTPENWSRSILIRRAVPRPSSSLRDHVTGGSFERLDLGRPTWQLRLGLRVASLIKLVWRGRATVGSPARAGWRPRGPGPGTSRTTCSASATFASRAASLWLRRHSPSGSSSGSGFTPTARSPGESMPVMPKVAAVWSRLRSMFMPISSASVRPCAVAGSTASSSCRPVCQVPSCRALQSVGIAGAWSTCGRVPAPPRDAGTPQAGRERARCQ